ncbi:hypothetical protein LX32DRAFT_425689 [Colletotrichum zoysiae]|uniref:Uncharacterized protein n=1 Tax=Colletotrichum zoysiae TaxID=1216348 RepID=A0AAD9HGH1_9PEZI|nr:hypothetical protein LX32DRAFT_425689 [Colletotrichum zoysiae]
MTFCPALPARGSPLEPEQKPQAHEDNELPRAMSMAKVKPRLVASVLSAAKMGQNPLSPCPILCKFFAGKDFIRSSCFFTRCSRCWKEDHRLKECPACEFCYREHAATLTTKTEPDMPCRTFAGRLRTLGEITPLRRPQIPQFQRQNAHSDRLSQSSVYVDGYASRNCPVNLEACDNCL